MLKEGNKLILARSADWDEMRHRIRGIVSAMEQGVVDDDEPEALAVEQIERTDPQSLEPLPRAEGLEASRRYERKSQEQKWGSASKPRQEPEEAAACVATLSDEEEQVGRERSGCSAAGRS